jgi:hypothetical protein
LACSPLGSEPLQNVTALSRRSVGGRRQLIWFAETILPIALDFTLNFCGAFAEPINLQLKVLFLF